MSSTRIKYPACPCCQSADIHSVLVSADHVSGELFEIWECAVCSVRFTQNVPDANAIKAYYQSEDYISHTDTSKGLVNRMYHFVRKRTLAGKYKLVVSALKASPGDQETDQRSILDIGAGTGAFVHYMGTKGWQATGLEPDEGARQRALNLHKIKLLPTEHLSEIKENSLSAVSLWHVLEHVHAIHVYLEQLKKIISPSGRIFIAVPNYTCYDAAVYKKYWAAYDVPRHLYHFSPAAMKQLLRMHALKLYAIHPMWYDSFYISMLSEKYKTGHSNIIKGSFTGAASNLKALLKNERCCSLIYIAGK